MRIKTDSTILIALMLIGLILIVSCTPSPQNPAANECVADGDCGGPYCSENFRKVVIPSCQEGMCVNTETECDQADICVADSKGVRCDPKEPEVRSCSENSKSTFIFLNNTFDSLEHICKDDCPVGFKCNNQCICECPAPVFTSTYFSPLKPDLDFETLRDEWENDPYSFLEITGTINITAYEHIRDGVSYYIPFPEVQLTRVPNTDLLDQYGGYCVNDYYDGDQALDIDLQFLLRPEETCIWGGAEGHEGVLTICPEDLTDWFNTFMP